MLKDILYALELGFRVLSTFLICIGIGYYLDRYLNSRPICILIGILIAFITVMRLLLKHE